MLLTIIQLVVSLLAILGAAIVFTNAVEILGERLELGVEVQLATALVVVSRRPKSPNLRPPVAR